MPGVINFPLCCGYDHAFIAAAHLDNWSDSRQTDSDDQIENPFHDFGAGLHRIEHQSSGYSVW